MDDIQFCSLNILDLVSSLKIVSFGAAEKAVIFAAPSRLPSTLIKIGVTSFSVSEKRVRFKASPIIETQKQCFFLFLLGIFNTGNTSHDPSPMFENVSKTRI